MLQKTQIGLSCYRITGSMQWIALLAAFWLSALTGCASNMASNIGSADVGPESRARAIDRALAPFSVDGGRLRIQPGLYGSPSAHLAQGLAAAERGAKLEAVQFLARAVAADPEAPEAYLPLAKLLRRLHRLDLAEAMLRRSIELDPKDLESRYELGMLLTTRGRHHEAAQTFEALLSRAPEDGNAYARLAAAHYFLGQKDSALAALDAAKRFGGRIPSALPALLEEPTALPPNPMASGSLVDAGTAVRLDAGGSAQATETSIAGAGQNLVAAWNDQREGTANGVWRLGAAYSTDGGASWNESLMRPPGAVADDFEGDPMSAFDRRTGDTWIGGVSFYLGGSTYVARRRAGNNFFDTPVIVNDNPDLTYDKPLMTAGPGPGAPNTTRLYVTYSEGLQSSGDLGSTWGPLVPLGIPFLELAYQPRVDADGVLSIVSWDSGDTIWLRRSVDGGASVSPRQAVATRLDVWGLQDSTRVPGQFRAPSLPSLAIAPDGTLYVAYADTTSIVADNANLDLYLTHSTDGGNTWSIPAVLNTDTNPPGDQFAPWLEVDTEGRLHVLFFDTRFTPQDDDSTFGLVDVSYAFSDDGGMSWHESRITETSFSSADAVWKGATNVPDYQFIGDYLGLTVLDSGDVVVVYPSASSGDLNVYSRRLETPIFVDGFESGGLSAWSSP